MLSGDIPTIRNIRPSRRRLSHATITVAKQAPLMGKSRVAEKMGLNKRLKALRKGGWIDLATNVNQIRKQNILRSADKKTFHSLLRHSQSRTYLCRHVFQPRQYRCMLLLSRSVRRGGSSTRLVEKVGKHCFQSPYVEQKALRFHQPKGFLFCVQIIPHHVLGISPPNRR